MDVFFYILRTIFEPQTHDSTRGLGCGTDSDSPGHLAWSLRGANIVQNGLSLKKIRVKPFFFPETNVSSEYTHSWGNAIDLGKTNLRGCQMRAAQQPCTPVDRYGQ